MREVLFSDAENEFVRRAFRNGAVAGRIGAQAVQAGFNHATRITSHAMKKPLSPKREGLKQATRQRRSLRRRVRGCPARPRRATGTTTATDAIGAAHEEVDSCFNNRFCEPADAKKVRAFSVNPRWAPALARLRSRRAPMRSVPTRSARPPSTPLSSPHRSTALRMHVCSAYALLNEGRSGILEDIRRRGSHLRDPLPSSTPKPSPDGRCVSETMIRRR